jgi:hypothetical protein
MLETQDLPHLSEQFITLWAAAAAAEAMEPHQLVLSAEAAATTTKQARQLQHLTSVFLVVLVQQTALVVVLAAALVRRLLVATAQPRLVAHQAQEYHLALFQVGQKLTPLVVVVVVLEVQAAVELA